MYDELIAAALDWAGSAIAVGSDFAQIDLDNLLDEEPPALAVMATMACVGAVRELCGRRGTDLEAGAVFPLEDVFPLATTSLVEVSTSSPAFSALREVDWTYGPGLVVPGLYLTRRSVWGGVESGESYRLRVNDPDVPSGFAAYFEASRTREGIERDWEFSRDVWVRAGGAPLSDPAD